MSSIAARSSSAAPRTRRSPTRRSCARCADKGPSRLAMSPHQAKQRRFSLISLAALLASIGLAWAGHEVPIYPSYYPHEIRIEAMPPQQAAELLGAAKLHAYLGPAPGFPAGLPATVRAIESLGGL